MGKDNNKNNKDNKKKDVNLKRHVNGKNHVRGNEGEKKDVLNGSEQGVGSSGNNVKPYNDSSWWFQNPEMARDAASIWFTQRVGTPIKGNSEKSTSDTPVGGICTVKFIPTYGVTGEVQADGYSKFDTSAINTAGLKLKWDIVHANSRNISYEASDLMKLFIAMDNIYMMLADAVRAYALMKQYSVANPYFGKTLVEACGWDYNSLFGRIADFRYQLNVLVSLVNKIHVPRVYNLFATHLNMINRVFADCDNERSQLYVCVANGYYKYDDSTGNMVWDSLDRCVNEGGTWKRVKRTKDFNFLSVIEERINEVLNSEYMGVMDGDILKRYGEEAMFKFPNVDYDEELMVVCDEEFNLMLSNSNFVGVPVVVRTSTSPERYELTNVPEVTIGKPSGESTEYIQIRIFKYLNDTDPYQSDHHNDFDKVVLNLPDDVEAKPETVMLSTRMWHSHESDGSIGPRGFTAEVDSVGTLMGQYCELRTFQTNGTVDVTETVWNLDFTDSIEARAISAVVLAASNQYKVTPRILLVDGNTGTFKDVAKVDNFAFIAMSQMQRLNYVAITSIFTEVNATPYGHSVKQ